MFELTNQIALNKVNKSLVHLPSSRRCINISLSFLTFILTNQLDQIYKHMKCVSNAKLSNPIDQHGMSLLYTDQSDCLC